jgi:hypothetical protein
VQPVPVRVEHAAHDRNPHLTAEVRRTAGGRAHRGELPAGPREPVAGRAGRPAWTVDPARPRRHGVRAGGPRLEPVTTVGDEPGERTERRPGRQAGIRRGRDRRPGRHPERAQHQRDQHRRDPRQRPAGGQPEPLPQAGGQQMPGLSRGRSRTTGRRHLEQGGHDLGAVPAPVPGRIGQQQAAVGALERGDVGHAGTLRSAAYIANRAIARRDDSGPPRRPRGGPAPDLSAVERPATAMDTSPGAPRFSCRRRTRRQGRPGGGRVVPRRPPRSAAAARSRWRASPPRRR